MKVLFVALALQALIAYNVLAQENEEVGEDLVELGDEFAAIELDVNDRRILSSRRKGALNPSHIFKSKVKTWVATQSRIARQLAKFDKRREEIGVAPANINWDGAGVQNQIGADGLGFISGRLFLATRQVINTPDLNVSNNGFVAATNGNSGFPAFSSPVNVATLNTDKVTVHFTLPDQTTSGLVNGFGVIFTDVEKSRKSGLKFYSHTGDLLLTVWAPRQSSGKQSFVGAIFDETIVASVDILLGDNGDVDFSTGKEKGGDFVAMDDWFFFLSDTEVPVTTFRGPVEDRNDEKIFTNFDRRRVAVPDGVLTNINWDGAGIVTNANNNGGTALLDRNTFKTSRQLTTHAANEDAAVSLNGFGVNQGLDAFTSPITFAPVDGKTLTLDFLEPNLVDTGLIRGFGAVFTDVELPGKTGFRCFDDDGEEICNVRARPQKSGTHQFVGIIFPRAVIARIVFDMGDNDSLQVVAAQTTAESSTVDHVATDDWLFFLAPAK